VLQLVQTFEPAKIAMNRENRVNRLNRVNRGSTGISVKLGFLLGQATFFGLFWQAKPVQVRN